MGSMTTKRSRTISILFAVNSSIIDPTGRKAIDEAAAWAKGEKAKGNANGWLVEVVGFADRTGNTAKNRALSERRSKSVIQYLVACMAWICGGWFNLWIWRVQTRCG